MQIQSVKGLNRKSRGILFHFKQRLEIDRTTLQVFIGYTFGFLKSEYTRKDFLKLIKSKDSKLIYEDIDQLFDQLDDSKNNRIFFYRIEEALNSIGPEDNPLSTTIERKTKFSKNEHDKKAFQALVDLKSILLRCQEYLKVIDLFDTQRSGYLTKINLQEMLKSLELSNPRQIQILIEAILQGKQRIIIDQLLQKLDLQDDGHRIDLSQLDIQQSVILDASQASQFMIKNSSVRQKQIIQQSIQLSRSIDQRTISIQKIPLALQSYFNYGSQLEQPFATIASQYISKNSIFIDDCNPKYSKATNWVHLAEGKTQDYFLFEASKSVIHRKERKGLGQLLQLKDVIQGQLGDCYFLTAIAGIVDRYPELVYRLFVLEKNPSHIYGIRLFLDGIWKTIIVDACFPVRNGQFCGAQPNNKEIWVMLLEKAWAKSFKNYDNIVAGYNVQGLNAVTGAPSIQTSTKDQGYLKRLQVQLQRGSIITCATSIQIIQLTDQEQRKLGIYAQHAYTVINIYPNLPYKNRTVRLLKIRNPWGKNEWKGDWSYNSNLWNQELREILNYKNNPNDGSFFMCMQDFLVYFDNTVISRVNLGYRNSWTQIKSSRYNFSHTVFWIKAKGDYHFTLYQENVRKYKNTFAYTKSKSWLFLCRLVRGQLRAIGSNSSYNHDNTLQATLKQGQYMIISKVQWKFWQQHTYTLTSYGPGRVQFKSIQQNSNKTLSDFIFSKEELDLGEKHIYKNSNIVRTTYFNNQQGFGFISIHNLGQISIRLKMHFNRFDGLQILKPYCLPLDLLVFPLEKIVVKLIVDPKGYKFRFQQQLDFNPII